MDDIIKQQIAKNKRLIAEGRVEGATWALLAGIIYLILIAVALR